VYHGETVRDVSWHPSLPLLVSSSWDRQVVGWWYDETPPDHDRPEASLHDESDLDAEDGDDDFD